MVKTMGDGVMALFPAPDAAAKAAVKMHVAIEVLPAIGEKKLALRIGFHSGPVIDRGDDLLVIRSTSLRAFLERLLEGRFFCPRARPHF
jgi:class 3 adenylate cyclase